MVVWVLDFDLFDEAAVDLSREYGCDVLVQIKENLLNGGMLYAEIGQVVRVEETRFLERL